MEARIGSHFSGEVARARRLLSLGVGGRGPRCHPGSSDNRPCDGGVSSRRRWLPAAQGAPRRLCRSKVRVAIWQDRVVFLAGGQTWATTAAGAQSRQWISLSADPELRTNTDALSFILR